MREVLAEQLADTSPAVRDLTDHVARLRGKQLRAGLVLLSARAAGNQSPELPTVAAIVELIHLATLVHDDVLDGASVRRRVASVNRRWDNQVAVLLGDFLYSRAFGLSTTLESRLCSRLLAETTRILCAGEIESSTRRYDFEMGQAAYEKICGAKTASLYSAACELGGRYPEGEPRRYEALRDFGWCVGLAFQIVDDCLDVMGSEEVVGKSVGNDVEDGKVTLPVLHLYAQGDERLRARLRDVYTLPEFAGRRAEELRAVCEPKQGVDYAMARAEALVRDGLARLETLPSSDAREVLETVGQYVLHRTW